MSDCVGRGFQALFLLVIFVTATQCLLVSNSAHSQYHRSSALYLVPMPMPEAVYFSDRTSVGWFIASEEAATPKGVYGEPLGKLKIEGEGARVFFKARASEEAGEFAEAQRLYEEVLSLEPDYIYAWSNLANSLTAQGDVKAALDCYKKAISLRPPMNTLGVMLLNKASVELSLKLDKEAIRDFEIAEKIAGPENRDTILQNKAVAMTNLGDWSTASELFGKVIKTADRNAQPWWLRYSMALLETGRGAEAVAYTQRSLNRYPGETECNAFATALYTSLGSKEASTEYWRTLSPSEQTQYSDPAFLKESLLWGDKSRAGMADFLAWRGRGR